LAFRLKKWNGEYNKPNPAGNNYFARFLDENRERRGTCENFFNHGWTHMTRIPFAALVALKQTQAEKKQKAQKVGRVYSRAWFQIHFSRKKAQKP